MILPLGQNLTRLSFKYSSFLRKSDVVCSLHLLHFSTSGEGQSAIHPPVYEYLVHNHHFSHASASRIASVVTHLRNPQKSDSVLSFLKEIGLSNSQLEKVVRSNPHLLSANLEKNIKPKIKIFRDLGLSAGDVAVIISKDATMFKYSIEKRIMPSLALLNNMFGSNELVKFWKDFGSFLKSDLDNSLVPNVEILKKCGVSMDQIIWMTHRFPRFMLRKPEDMKKYIDKADGMGVSRSSSRFIRAVSMFSAFSDETWALKQRTLRELGFPDGDIAAAFRKSPSLFALTVETWALKLSTLREMGFSNDDIAAVFRKHPQVFASSNEKMKEAKEVLVANGKYDLSCIIQNPVSLGLSIEKRHKPRIRVLELLEGKNLIQSWPGFSTFCRMSDRKFFEKYVAPFVDEIGEVYIVKSAPSG